MGLSVIKLLMSGFRHAPCDYYALQTAGSATAEQEDA
jgi:hypothetical protein